MGQLNSPIAQLINFIRELQDARISLDRLAEIHNKEDEEQQDTEKTHEIPEGPDIKIKDMSFRYIGSDIPVLSNLDLEIPANKITAIVGVSGSGKTTLMKLLLKFYEPDKGEIRIGNYDLKNVSQKTWRDISGVVMQEGYIFNDTIAHNIAVGVDHIDKKKLAHAVEVANIQTFIETLPLNYNTKIGMEGVGLSTGQKQRLLIARSVYENPDYLFFDDATSALGNRPSVKHGEKCTSNCGIGPGENHRDWQSPIPGKTKRKLLQFGKKPVGTREMTYKVLKTL